MSTESEIHARRYKREKLARLQAEGIAENKSRELYLKGLELEHSLEVISRTKREIETLHGALEAFAGSLEVEEIINHLQKFLGARLDGFSATVCLNDDEDGKGAAYSLDNSVCRHDESMARHGYDAIWGLASSMAEPSMILGTADAKLLAELGYREPVLLVPFISGAKLIGFLAVHCEHELDDGDAVEFLRSLAREAAVSLQNALLFRKVERLSWTDPLTGLSNRRSFQQQGEPIVQLAKRHNRSLSAAMLDIDFFKRVNDTYGHSTGDEVLRGVADALVSSIRSSDIVGRYGGEEFCFVFPETEVEGARQIAERVRNAVAGLTFSDGEREFSVTVSIGEAELTGSRESLDELLSRCDKALYIAKESGRNRVVVV